MWKQNGEHNMWEVRRYILTSYESEVFIKYCEIVSFHGVTVETPECAALWELAKRRTYPILIGGSINVNICGAVLGKGVYTR